MRILIHGINYSPELVGIGKYTTELAEFLVSCGHQVRMVTAPPYYPAWEVPTGYSAWQYRRETCAGVQVVRCPLYVPRQATGTKRLLHLLSFALTSAPVALAQAAWKPHLVISIAPAIVSAPFAWLASRLAGCPAWLHIQDFELDTALSLGLFLSGRDSGIKKMFIASLLAIERWLLNRFDRVSTISQRMLAHLHGKTIPPVKTLLLPNWVDCQSIFPASTPGTYRLEWGVRPGQLLVLYSGNMGKKQGLELLIESAREFTTASKDDPGAQPIFVLCGDGAARRELEQQAHGLSNVMFIPLQPASRLNELLNSADVHALVQLPDVADRVMPSKLSGMLASGKPVIATASPGTELASVVARVGLLVPPGNVAEFCSAIRSLASSPGLRDELGIKGREYALAHWDKQGVLENFVAQLDSLQV